MHFPKILSLAVVLIALLALTHNAQAMCTDDPAVMFQYANLDEICGANKLPKNFLTCNSTGFAAVVYANKTCTAQADCEPLQCLTDPFDPTKMTCQPIQLEAGASCYGPDQCQGTCMTFEAAQAEYKARGFSPRVWGGASSSSSKEDGGGYGSLPSSSQVGLLLGG
jgi:hypothetical protein